MQQLTVRDVAAIFRVPESHVYKWAHDEDLPSRQVGGRTYFDRTELLEWAGLHRIPFDVGLVNGKNNEGPPEETLAGALATGGLIQGVEGSTKAEVFAALVRRLNLPDGADRGAVEELLMARESVGSTAVGDGIAIPHPRQPLVLGGFGCPSLTICQLAAPLAFDAPDGLPVQTLFVLISPTIRSHLRVLARLSRALQEPSLRQALKRRAPLEQLAEELRRVDESSSPTSAVTAGEPA
ncbi:PTS sugar transporter subunit IIA [Isosphaeraceae bacterium EP7]